MGINLKFDQVCGVLRAEAKGRVKLREYREALQQITSGKLCPATAPAIWDLRDFDFTYFDSQLAENTSNIRGEFSARKIAKVAYVVSSGLGFGMIRMLQTITDTSDHSKVFYEYEEADEWLKSFACGGQETSGDRS